MSAPCQRFSKRIMALALGVPMMRTPSGASRRKAFSMNPLGHNECSISINQSCSHHERSLPVKYASKSMPRAVRREVGAVSGAQAGERSNGGDAQRFTSRFAQGSAGAHRAVVVEAHEALVEGCVPERGEEQPIVHVEASRDSGGLPTPERRPENARSLRRPLHPHFSVASDQS